MYMRMCINTYHLTAPYLRDESGIGKRAGYECISIVFSVEMRDLLWLSVVEVVGVGDCEKCSICIVRVQWVG